MRNLSLKSLLITVFSLMILLSGGLAQAYLAPDYNTFGPGQFVIGPGVLPDYLTTPNWAFTPPLRKFIDPLPGLCNPATDEGRCVGGKKIPIAIPDKVTYPGSDYYEIELQQYSEMMHSDLVNPTTLRGYVQVNNGTDTSSCTVPVAGAPLGTDCTVLANNTITPGGIHFLGPIIIATKGRPVRVLFKNKLNPTGGDGDLFLPVDDTIMGAGAYDIDYNPVTKLALPGGAHNTGMFSTNRATLHLHGGRSPWISDGTPHQWIDPATDQDPNYPHGISVSNVPDMTTPAPAAGEQTFFWTNQQSSRMMFYHDHAWGITRLNVYAGEAAGYLIRDDVEQGLITAGIIPTAEIPLVIMDKTFVDANPLSPTYIGLTDPTWNWGTGAITATGVVTHITVTDGGSGYDIVNPPAVTITGAHSVAATATAAVSSVITTIDVVDGGSGYVAPIVMITDDFGQGATAQANLDPLNPGVILSITVTHGGFDYSTTPIVTITDPNNPNYTPASATANVSAVVSAVAITNGGSGYTAPTVSIAPPLPGGVQAYASATLTDIRELKTGDLWWPHVYMPAQNPFDVSGVAPMGRWAYGPYFYPATNNLYQPVPNPYFSPYCDPADDTTPGSWGGFCQAPEIPSTPNPSWGAEAFMDTPLVNGTAYPYVDLEPKAYRLRILNAAHDRFMNLSMYTAVDATGTLCDSSNPDPSLEASGVACTEIAAINAAAPLPGGYPATWPIDGRPGGVPDALERGPNWIMIGNEGGFLPMPVEIPSHPTIWNVNPSMFNVGNITGGSLILGPAERADVIVDFSAYAGKTLILYNDGSAPWPALNPQYDFYTGNPDGTASGSAPSTAAGYGPNIRTIMQIRIADIAPDPTFDIAKLKDAFDPTTDVLVSGAGVFQQAQEPIIVAQGDLNPAGDPIYETFMFPQDFSAYSKAYGNSITGPAVFPTTSPNWGLAQINDAIINFKTLNADGSLNPTVQSIDMKRKSIHDEMGATFDDYGRMRAALGLELANGGAQLVNFIVQTYSSPATEFLKEGEVQVWKITHNGVDTHPIHFHLFDVQVINRVGWDGFVRLPDPTELGWKETVRISPLEDTIVAFRPIMPELPFAVPASYRPLNPAAPIGSTTEITQVDPITGNAATRLNAWYNFQWEYVWHCHILSHEENDMMRPMVFVMASVLPAAPTDATAALDSKGVTVTVKWKENSGNIVTGFNIYRNGSLLTTKSFPNNNPGTGTFLSYVDSATAQNTTYSYEIEAVNSKGVSATRAATGSVTTNNLTKTPVVKLITPKTGATYKTVPTSIRLGASAVVATGWSISKVEFYNGATLLGTGTYNSGGYYFDWATALLPTGQYTITAVATTNWGVTATSAPITIRFGAAAPSSLTVVSYDNNTRGVSLLATPSGTPGANYVFEFSRSVDGGTTWSAWAVGYSGISRNPYFILPAINGIYRFQVKVTAAGYADSAYTAGNITVTVSDPTATAPATLSLVSYSNNTRSVSLLAAASGTPGANYVFEYSRDTGGGTWSAWAVGDSGTNRNPTFTLPAVNGIYRFQVKVTATGYIDSGYTAGDLTVTVLDPTATAPATLSLVSYDNNTRGVSLSAAASGTPGANYVFEYSADGTTWTVGSNSTNRNPYFILPAGAATYQFRVYVTATGYTNSGYTATGSTVTVTLLQAAAPSSLSLVSYDNNTRGVSLSATASGTPGANYVFEYSADGTTWTVGSNSTNRNPYFILPAGAATYQFRVYVTATGYTNSGYTATGSTVTVTLLQAAAPSSLSLVSYDNNTRGVSLSAAASGTPGANYVFEYSADGTTWTVGSNSTNRNPYFILPAVIGTYQFRVYVTASGYIASGYTATGSTATVTLPQAAAASPLSVVSFNSTTRGISLIAAASGTPGRIYHFEYSTDGTTWVEGYGGTNRNPYFILPAVPGTYQFRVYVTAAGYANSSYTAAGSTVTWP